LSGLPLFVLPASSIKASLTDHTIQPVYSLQQIKTALSV